LLVLLLGAGPASYAASGAGAQAGIIFRIDADQIVESSSLAVSTVHRGFAYTTNDSGDGPYVYMLDRQGRLVGTTTLSGVTPVDIEAISAGRDGSLVVADIGDNSGTRDSVVVYKIPQPSTGDHTVTPTALTLHYADGPRNAESMIYDPASGRVLVVSKLIIGAKIYRTPKDAFSRDSAMLRPVADAPMMATDASLLPEHHAIVVRTYLDAVVYHYPGLTSWTDLELPAQEQGESIAWVPGGKKVWVGSEGVDSPVWSVPLPDLSGPLDAASGPRAEAPAVPAPSGGSGPPDGAAMASPPRVHQPSSIVRVGTSAGAVAALVGVVVLLSRPRRNRAGD